MSSVTLLFLNSQLIILSVSSTSSKTIPLELEELAARIRTKSGIIKDRSVNFKKYPKSFTGNLSNCEFRKTFGLHPNQPLNIVNVMCDLIGV
jgi:hypothetical protein